MLEQIRLRNILFLDIETVPSQPSYDALDTKLKALWDRKAAYLEIREEKTPAELYSRAGIYAEFGKIICICAGYISHGGIRIKAFYGDDEAVILNEFSALLNRFSGEQHYLCAHNGKEFDFPYIARRMVVNGIALPEQLNLHARKPWEVKHLDTLELWKFGDRKNYTSLDLLTTILNIPSPKQDIDGSDVGRVYWVEKDLERIVSYCRRDVVAIAQLVLRFKGEPLLDEGSIYYVDQS